MGFPEFNKADEVGMLASMSKHGGRRCALAPKHVRVG